MSCCHVTHPVTLTNDIIYNVMVPATARHMTLRSHDPEFPADDAGRLGLTLTLVQLDRCETLLVHTMRLESITSRCKTGVEEEVVVSKYGL